MPASTTTLANAMKTVYAPTLREAINSSSPVLEEIKRITERIDFEGEKYQWSVHGNRSSSTRAVAELGTLPAAGQQGYLKPEVTTREIVHTIKLSRKVIKAARSNRGAFVRAVKSEMAGAEENLPNDVCRQLYGTGTAQNGTETVLRTGKIARVQGVAGNVLTLGESAAPLEAPSTMVFFEENMTLTSIIPTTGAVRVQSMTITAVDVDLSTITVDAAGATAAGDIIVRGDANGSAYDQEIFGLRVLINNNAGDQYNGANTVLIHGISSATNSKWRSEVVGSSTTPVSEKLLNDSWRRQQTRGAGKKKYGPVFISPEQEDELANQMTALKRYDGATTEYGVGWTGIKLARGIAVPDRYAPTDLGFRITPDELGYVENSPFEWDDEDGKVLFKTASQLAYEARFVGDINLAVLVRNAHVRIVMERPAA